MKKTSKSNKHYNFNSASKKQGMSLVEVVVGSAIILVSMVSLIGIFGGLTNLSLRNSPKVQAAMLLDEGSEVLRLMRDSGWNANINSLTNGTTYRLTWQSNMWKATTSSAMIDGYFDRTFTLAAVSRDSTTYDIVSSGGVADTGTKKATVTVSWNDGTGTTSKSVQLYLYNTYSN